MADIYAASGNRYERMTYRRVGKSGLKFPAVSLGFWHNFGTKDNYDNMKAMCRAAAIMKELHCPLIVNQRRYSIFDRGIEQDGVKAYCKEAGMGVIAFSPLAQGLLTDKYLHGIPADSRIARDPRFLQESALTAERLEQITENAKIVEKCEFSIEELNEIEKISN